MINKKIIASVIALLTLSCALAVSVFAVPNIEEDENKSTDETVTVESEIKEDADTNTPGENREHKHHQRKKAKKRPESDSNADATEKEEPFDKENVEGEVEEDEKPNVKRHKGKKKDPKNKCNKSELPEKGVSEEATDGTVDNTVFQPRKLAKGRTHSGKRDAE